MPQPGGAGRVVVADPVGTEVNQAWVSWKRESLLVKAGRLRRVVDNARFVGREWCDTLMVLPGGAKRLVRICTDEAVASLGSAPAGK